MEQLLRPRQVEQTLGFRRTKLWKRIKERTLPEPIRRSPRDLVWLASEVQAVLAADVRGDSTDQLRALCASLVSARKTRDS